MFAWPGKAHGYKRSLQIIYPLHFEVIKLPKTAHFFPLLSSSAFPNKLFSAGIEEEELAQTGPPLTTGRGAFGKPVPPRSTKFTLPHGRLILMVTSAQS